MKKRYILLASLVLCVVLCVLILTADLCIGRIESRTDDQWSHVHLYMNDQVTLNFPVTAPDQPFVFQAETGRGAFTVTITDADGNILHSQTADSNTSAVFTASSDLTLQIQGKGHGGGFTLIRLDHLTEEGTAYDPDALLGEGYHTGDTFTVSYDCLKILGKRVNFYVENNGTEAVTLTINGSYSRTLPPGGSGHISATISTTVVPQTMILKCVSANGGELDIYWKAAQRK